MTGLHTLVDGLAFSPTSPIDSPPAIGSSDLSSSLTAESSNHSSIFNNPSSSSTAVTSPANTPRLQSFGSRRINYGQGGSSTSSTPQRMRRRNSDPIVKEVDDPSTTTPTALVNANKVRYLTPSSFSKLFSTHTLPPRSSQRNSSHKGMELSYPVVGQG